jgi:hypothetical protein
VPPASATDAPDATLGLLFPLENRSAAWLLLEAAPTAHSAG